MAESENRSFDRFAILMEGEDEAQYRIQIDFEGIDPDDDTLATVTGLPPSYDDLIAQSGPGTPQRSWRRDPAAAGSGDLVMCIGDTETLKAFGGRLFEAVLPGAMATAYGVRFNASRYHRRGTRIRIDLPPDRPELATVPWEAMWWRSNDLFPAIEPETPLFRYQSAGIAAPPPEPLTGTLKLLIAIAVPQQDLDARQELIKIEQRVQDAALRNNVKVETLTIAAATRSELARQLDLFEPDVLHFIGHGDFVPGQDGGRGTGYLYLVGEGGGYDRISARDVRDLISLVNPRLVVLNTCMGAMADRFDRFGGTAQSLLQRAVPYVVAMQYPISDKAALEFSDYFYGWLLRGRAVDAAVARGRRAIHALPEPEKIEMITPVLYSSVAEPGPLFVPGPAMRERAAPPAAEAGPPARERSGRFMLVAGVAAGLLVVAAGSVWMSSGSAPGTAPVDAGNTASLEEEGPPPPDVSNTMENAKQLEGVIVTGAQNAPAAPRIAYEARARAAAEPQMTAPAAEPLMAPAEEGASAIRMPEIVARPPIAAPADPSELGRRARRRAEQDLGRVTGGLNQMVAGGDATMQVRSPNRGPAGGAGPPAQPLPVFFGFGSVSPDPQAMTVLRQWAEQYRLLPGPVTVVGHADSVGSPAVNQRVGLRRARAVADMLVRLGVPEEAIAVESRGESEPLLPTADGVAEPRNRRVEVVVGAPREEQPEQRAEEPIDGR